MSYRTFVLQDIGCDRPINYKTENLREVLRKEYPVSKLCYWFESQVKAFEIKMLRFGKCRLFLHSQVI